MTITKLLYKNIIYSTKKEFELVYILKTTYNNFYVVCNFRNVILFLKINDNETPRSYHDPKVPAHDV